MGSQKKGGQEDTFLFGEIHAKHFLIFWLYVVFAKKWYYY